MMKKLLYPGMPKILQDVWVLTELALTITQFVLAVTSISFASERVFNILLLTIICIGLLLALVDSFLHFVQLGSCVATINYFRKIKQKKATKRKVTQNKSRSMICEVSEKRKQQVAEILDFLRNWITDIVLYPLVIFDLNDVIKSESYLVQSSGDKLNLSLFTMGVISLILSVYISRFILMISAAINFRRVSYFSSGCNKKVYNMALWFLLHIFVQTLVHASIFISIGMNIHLENTELPAITDVLNRQDENNMTNTFDFIPYFNDSGNFSTLLPNIPFSFIPSGFGGSSFFLVFSSIAGLFVTQLGIASFFIVNYYQVRELSIKFWVDMISLLQSESFTGLVFDGGIKNAKNQAKEIVKNVKLKKVKDDLKSTESIPTISKVLYPCRVPVFVVLGLLYFFLLVMFLTFLGVVCIQGSDEVGPLCLSHFQIASVYSIPYFFTFTLVILANIHVIVLVSLLLLVVLAITLSLLFWLFSIFI